MRALLLLLSFVPLSVLAADPPPATRPVYSASESAPETGTRLRKDIGRTSLYPLDKPWQRFSEEEKARVRELYEDMRPGDEPPFPARGMQPVLEMLTRVMGAAGKRGLVHLDMTVDAEGKTTMFKIYEMPDLDTAKYVAAVFNSTKFKPASCAGRPCRMDFPFKVRIVLE